jgi:hypothetical protein
MIGAPTRTFHVHPGLPLAPEIRSYMASARVSLADGLRKGQVFTFGNDLREEAVIAGLPTG